MKRWFHWLVALTLGAAFVAAYPLSSLPPVLRNSALIGWLISLVISASSGFLAFWSLDHSQRVFMLVTFGGMLARLTIVAVVVGFAVVLGRVHLVSFLIGLLGAYTVYHALEVLMLSRHRATATLGDEKHRVSGPSGVAV